MKLWIFSMNRCVSRSSCTNPLTMRTPLKVEARIPLMAAHSR